MTLDGTLHGLIPTHKRHRVLVWLLVCSGLASLLLISIALRANALSTRAFQDVNLSGSLRFRCLWIYGATHGGQEDPMPQVAQIDAIRASLRARYPQETAMTDGDWNRMAHILQSTGRIDWRSANAAREAFNRLTEQIAVTTARQNAAAAHFLEMGLIGLLGSLAAMLTLLRGLRTTEKALQEERNFQAALLDSLQEGIVACNAAGTLTLFNRATREFHGLPFEPIPPDQWAEHFDLYAADGLTAMATSEIPLFRAFQGERVHEAEMVIAPRTGTPRTILASGQAIFGANGEKLGAVAAMHDITTRRQAERELERLAAIVESSSEAILVANLDGILVSWNRGAEHVYGYAAQEVIGQHASVLTLPGEQSPVPFVVAGLLRGEDPPAMEVRRRRKDGVLVDLSLSFSPVRDDAGTIIGVSCISRDITAQKRAEAALAESEERLRRLSDAAFEGIAVSQDGVILDANPAFAYLFGYSGVTEIIGTFAGELAAPESKELILAMIRQGVESPYEAVCRRPDGTTFDVEVRARMTVWNGRAARVTAVRDITARKTMEETLRVSEERFRTAVDAMEEGLVLQDRNGAIVMCNDSAERILGLTADQLIGRESIDPQWKAVRENGSDFPGHDHPAMVALRSGVPQKNVVMGIHKPGGALTWVAVNAVPLFDPTHEKPYGVVVTFGDITERTLTEERFRVLFEQSSDTHVLVDERGIVDCNHATIAMLRCKDKAQVLSLHPSVFSPEFQPDGRRSAEKAHDMEELARERGMHRFEWTHMKMDGETFPVEITLTPVTLQGKPVFLAVWHDLTDRKIAERHVQDLAVALQFQNEELERANAELASLATTDGLTGLKNHRCFQERLAEDISGAIRYQRPLSVVLLDVDHFKTFNDQFGHPAGDEVLRQVARILLEQSRITDLVARYGGEEFILLLPETDALGAMVIAERIRKAIESAQWPLRPITASFGVASLGLGCNGGQDLVTRADQALYFSKAGGRDRVTCNGLATDAALLG